MTVALWFAALLAQTATYDLAVYGATAGGVMTAVAAGRQGLKTVLLEPGTHVGGMATGGLSRTDVGKREVIGGLALEFYYRVGVKYDTQRYNVPVAWFYEPKVGEAVLKEMLKEAGVAVLYKHRLREKDGVSKTGANVTAITTENGATFAAKYFADCTYEGDLVAQAKISYTFGRESTAQYGESLAGVGTRTRNHQFEVEIPARDASGALLPEVDGDKPGPEGSADKRIQAYNFRIIATDDPKIRAPWPKPRGYDPKRFELLARLLPAMEKLRGRPLVFHDVVILARIPNRKADLNNRGAFSTDYIGRNYDYPDGDYATRAKIWQAHVDYDQGFFYFLANDPRVPKGLQAEVRQWGLPRDEFLDTAHWPFQLYVREARRMVGDFVLTQKDLQTDLLKPDVVGMGSYNSDSHNLHRYVNDKGFSENEGNMEVPVKPYQIPYRIMLPKRAEAANVFVPVPFSASHVTFSSARMEPQWMILGHAAGVAAALAMKGGHSVQDVPVDELQKILKSQGAVFEYVPSPFTDALTILRNALRPKGVARFNWE